MNQSIEFPELTILTAHAEGEPGNLQHASLDAPEWLERELKGNQWVVQRTPISEFAPYIWEMRNLHKHLSYSDWQRLADQMPEMLATTNPTGQTPEGEPTALSDLLDHHTPPDLPPIIAEQRLENIVDALPDPRLADMKKELLEIVLASRHARPVNLKHFRPDSLNRPSWAVMTSNLDMGDLMDGGRAAQAELDHINRGIEKSEQSDEARTSINQYRERRNLEQEIRETEYLIDLCYEQNNLQANQTDQTTRKAPTHPTVLQNALDATITRDPKGQTTVLITYTGLDRQQMDTVIIDPDPTHMNRVHNPEHAVDLCSLADLARDLWRHSAIHETMTYTHWARLSEFIKPHLTDNLIDEPGLCGIDESIPTDLPPIIAEQRLNLIDRFPKPENLQAKLELTEIIMANLYGEPVNETVFSPGSLKSPLWHDIADQITARECAILVDEESNAVDALSQPDSDKGRFALAARQQTLAELHHLADRCAHHEHKRARLTEHEVQHPEPMDDDEPTPIAPGL